MSSTESEIVDVYGLEQMLKKPPVPILLDVREQDEWQYCRIDVASLAGGIDAWSVRIDRKVPRY